MKKLVYSILFISSITFAQVEKNVGEFTKVTSFDKIDVLLIKGNENKVILSGTDVEEVEIVNKNGELKIRMPLTKMLSGDNVSATVYYTKLEAIEANEGSRISSEDIFTTTTFDVIAKEGSQIKIKLDVSRLTLRVANGSIVNVEGKATNQDIIVNSGGIYEAKKLLTNQTVITTNAGGEASIYATELVDAKVRAGGDITVYGNPKQLNQKIIAGGKVRKAE
jgi:Putative auto-transporter adhesin, head GIN domain